MTPSQPRVLPPELKEEVRRPNNLASWAWDLSFRRAAATCISASSLVSHFALPTLGQTTFISGMQKGLWHFQEDCSQPRLWKHPASVGQEALDSTMEEIKKGYCSPLSLTSGYRHNKALKKTHPLTHFFSKHLLGPCCMSNPCVRDWLFLPQRRESG